MLIFTANETVRSIMMFAIDFLLNKTHTVGLILMAYALIFPVLRIVTVSIHVNFLSTLMHQQYIWFLIVYFLR